MKYFLFSVPFIIMVIFILFPNWNPLRKKRLFPEFSTLKYKAFRFWKRWQYFKFFFGKDNYDYDWSSLLSIMELKLTMMGLHFAKYGVIIDVDRKKQVRTIWQTRKHIQNSLNSFDITYERAQKKFKEKYGFEYESKMNFTEIEGKGYGNIEFELILPYRATDEEKKQIEEYWHSVFGINDDYAYESEHINKAMDLIKEHIRFWWD